MTSGQDSRSGGIRGATRSSRRELTLALLLGAAGAGIVFLASRQGWAQVRTIPPKPLPASQVTVTGSALVPYSGALALAGLATLAAVLASRGLARRLSGLLLALIGVGLAASAFTVTSAGAISAASSNVGPATAGAASVTGGTGQPTSVPDVAGAAPHVTFSAGGWQALVVVGALAVIAAGVLVVWRAARMAVMSGRYDSPTGEASRARPSPAAGVTRGPANRRPGAEQAAAEQSGAGRPGAGRAASASPLLAGAATGAAGPGDSASIWEALSRGDDPTAVDTGPQKA
jgi:uncharacterized membrane protein (TIGR02234 family)